MTRTRSPRPRVALAAVPGLLAQSLQALLASHAEVTLVLEHTDEHFDVAIVTDLAPRVNADVVIVLDEEPSSRGGGMAHGPSTAAPVRLHDLDEVIGYVVRAGG